MFFHAQLAQQRRLGIFVDGQVRISPLKNVQIQLLRPKLGNQHPLPAQIPEIEGNIPISIMCRF